MSCSSVSCHVVMRDVMVPCGQISVVEVSGKASGKDKQQHDKYQLAHALDILVHPADADPQSIQSLN